MAWRTVTESDLLEKFSDGELGGLRSPGLADGQPDPVAGQILKVVNLVRGYIRANPENRLGPEGTLPEALILPAVDYLVVEIGSRVAGILIDINNVRQDARKDALSLFRATASGGFAVEQPTEAAAETPAGASVELVTPAPVNNATRETLKGL